MTEIKIASEDTITKSLVNTRTHHSKGRGVDDFIDTKIDKVDSVYKKEFHECAFCKYQTDLYANFLAHIDTCSVLPSVLRNMQEQRTLSSKSESFKQENVILHITKGAITIDEMENKKNCYKCPNCDFKSELLHAQVHVSTCRKWADSFHDSTNLMHSYETENRTLKQENDVQYVVKDEIVIDEMEYEKPYYKCGNCNFESELYYTHQMHISTCCKSVDSIHDSTKVTHHDLRNRKEKERLHKYDRNVNETHKSLVCNQTLATKKNFGTHVKKVRGKIENKCDVCNKIYINVSALRAHIKAKHENVKYVCNKCPKIYITKTSLKLHILAIHDKIKNHCSICGKIFSYKADLLVHVRTIHENINHKCAKCHKTYSTKGGLNVHILTVHDNIKNKCDVCDKTFNRKRSLNIHKKVIHENIKHKCTICNKIYCTMEYLKAHVSAIHDKTRNKCNVCDKTFVRKTGLNIHMKAIHRIIKHK